MHSAARATLLGIALACATPSFAHAEGPSYIGQWGGTGSGAGQLNKPAGIACDASGNVYVCDSANWRIQIFSPTGGFRSQFGSQGFVVGQFEAPFSVAVDAAGNIFVGDHSQRVVEKFDASGAWVRSWAGMLLGFEQLAAIAVDADGTVYTGETNSQRVTRWTNGGDYLAMWGTYVSPDWPFTQQMYVQGLASDGHDQLFMCDNVMHQVYVYRTDGTFVRAWGSRGAGPGQFSHPTGIAIDANGIVYVADERNHRIQMFTSDGTFLAQWGSFGSGPGQFKNPYSVAVAPSGLVYVSDTGNNRIQVFGPLATPAHSSSWGALKAAWR